MIIKDIKQLRVVPVGEVVTLSLEVKVVETSLDHPVPCDGCVFTTSCCDQCSAQIRFDGREVKFVKI